MKLPDKLPPLADQVCRLEQSRKLWELGARLEGRFAHFQIGGNWDLTGPSDLKGFEKGFDLFPAYTGSELDHLLPFICGCMKLRKGYKMRRLSGSWFDDNPPHPTPAIAKADLLIHLIEEGEVTL